MAAIVIVVDRCMKHLDYPDLEQLSLLDLACKNKVIFPSIQLPTSEAPEDGSPFLQSSQILPKISKFPKSEKIEKIHKEYH